MFRILSSKKIQLCITLSLCFMIIAAGSIAWISATQQALNEFTFSPEGVNLHDDFNDPNKDVYVENSGTEPLLVRVKLREYTEIGKDLQIPEFVNNTPPAPAEKAKQETWFAHTGVAGTSGVTSVNECAAVGRDSEGVEHTIHEHWRWIMDKRHIVDGPKESLYLHDKNQKWYVPAVGDQMLLGGEEMGSKSVGYDDKAKATKSTVKGIIEKDGLPELDGFVQATYKISDYATLLTAINKDGAISDPTTGFDVRLEQAKIDLYEAVFDGETQEIINQKREELHEIQAAFNQYTFETYGIQQTRPAQVVTMEEWTAGGWLNERGESVSAMMPGDYWVVNPDDGWCYWAAPLEPGESTGLLLDAVIGSEKLKDERTRYYYGIDVIMQAVTVDDVTEFWSPSKPEAIAEIGLFGEADEVYAKPLLLEVGKTIDLNAGTGTHAIAGRSAAVSAETQKGKYWRLSGAVWKFYDGHWRYDGNDWTLDGEEYPFHPDGWFMSDGEWHYLDDEWMFDANEWTPVKPKAASEEAGSSKEDESSASSAAPESSSEPSEENSAASEASSESEAEASSSETEAESEASSGDEESTESSTEP